MRELTVYYCSKCGNYGYYRQPERAFCSNCDCSMTELPISYQNFMNLDIDLRNELISAHIAQNAIPASSVFRHMPDLEKENSGRCLTDRLKARIEKLETENFVLHKQNEKQSETIAWMHDLIWDLMKQIHSADEF